MHITLETAQPPAIVVGFEDVGNNREYERIKSIEIRLLSAFPGTKAEVLIQQSPSHGTAALTVRFNDLPAPGELEARKLRIDNIVQATLSQDSYTR